MCVQGGASVHTRMCVCRCFYMDIGLGACLHLCVCLHPCVRCPWTQELWRDPVFGFLHRRDGALPQPLLRCLGAHGPLFSAQRSLFPPFTARAHGAQAWDNDRQVVVARGAVPAPPTSGAEGSLVLFRPPASSSLARGQRLSASHRNQILPRDKILSPLFCGEKTTSAPGQTTGSLSKGISGQGLGATSRSWNEEPAGVLAPGVLPQGSAFLPGPEPYPSPLSIPPSTIASSPRTQNLPHRPPSPTPDQNHLP